MENKSTHNFNVFENNDFYKLLFESITEGVIVTNIKGNIVKTNSQIEIMFGYTEKELIGEKVELLIPNRFKPNHSNYRAEYAKNSKKKTMGKGRDLYALRKNNTEFPIEISLNYFNHLNEKYLIALLSDITGRRKIQDELLEMNNQLEKKVEERTKKIEEAQLEISKALEQEKKLNELKSRFVSMASHEFRTPLSTISSSTTLAEKYDSNDLIEKRSKHLKRIKSSVKNLTNILNDFLSISKLEEGLIQTNIEEINLPELILEIVDEFESEINLNKKISYSHNGLKNIKSDINLLRNTLTNLVSNAIKYTDNNGKINVLSDVKDDNLVIKVIDNGIGIPKEDQKMLFERFHRASNVANIQGTGLGLNIIARYIKLLNGNITFKSTEGEGSTFTIVLPI